MGFIGCPLVWLGLIVFVCEIVGKAMMCRIDGSPLHKGQFSTDCESNGVD